MKICIDVDEDLYAALRTIKDLYPEMSFREFVNTVIKPQLQKFLRRNVENMLQQISWAYRVVRTVISSK